MANDTHVAIETGEIESGYFFLFVFLHANTDIAPILLQYQHWQSDSCPLENTNVVSVVSAGKLGLVLLWVHNSQQQHCYWFLSKNVFYIYIFLFKIYFLFYQFDFKT